MGSELTKAQRLALEWAKDGFSRVSGRSTEMIDAGLTMYTVAGLVRRGWIAERRGNGLFYITDEGRAALADPQADGGENG